VHLLEQRAGGAVAPGVRLVGHCGFLRIGSLQVRISDCGLRNGLCLRLCQGSCLITPHSALRIPHWAQPSGGAGGSSGVPPPEPSPEPCVSSARSLSTSPGSASARLRICCISTSSCSLPSSLAM